MLDIFKLRPKEQTVASIREALERAVAADSDQSAALRRALHERDALLLDGSAPALKAAETALSAAREPAERVSAIRRQLEQRLADATKAEALATVEAARISAEEADRIHVAWWLSVRKRLATEFSEGIALMNRSDDAAAVWEAAAQKARLEHPEVEFAPPVPHANDVGSWLLDVGLALRVGNPGEIADIGNPNSKVA